MRLFVFLAGLCLIFQAHSAPPLAFKYTQAEQDVLAEIVKKFPSVWLNLHQHGDHPTMVTVGEILERFELTEYQRCILTTLQTDLPSYQSLQAISQVSEQAVRNEGIAPHIWSAIVSIFLMYIGQKPDRWSY